MGSKHYTLLQTFLAFALTYAVAAPALARIAKQSYQGHEAAADEVLIKFQQAPPNDVLAAAQIAADTRQDETAADVDVARGVGSAGSSLVGCK